MIKKTLKYALITLIWLLIWQIAAAKIGEELLFPSPLSVAKRLIALGSTMDFYKTIAISLSRILLGMVIGMLIGAVGGTLTAISRPARDFFAPLLAVVKATPVASFIILLVLWVSRDKTPLIIAAMMVVPVVWSNAEQGIRSTDKQLLEMARAYKMPPLARVLHIYLPSVTPYFLAALRSALGMAWKAGIAAEALLLPLISIGKRITDARVSLETADMFAWTVVVILLSMVIERSMLSLFKLVSRSRAFGTKGGVPIG